MLVESYNSELMTAAGQQITERNNQLHAAEAAKGKEKKWKYSVSLLSEIHIQILPSCRLGGQILCGGPQLSVNRDLPKQGNGVPKSHLYDIV